MKMAYETIFWHGGRTKQLRKVLGLTLREFSYYIQINEFALCDHEKNKYARGWWSQIENKMNKALSMPDSLLSKRFLQYKDHLIINVKIIDKVRFDEEMAFCNEILKHIWEYIYETN